MASAADIAIVPDAVAAEAGDGAAELLLPDMPEIPAAAPRDTAYWLRCLATAAFLHVAVFGYLSWPAADNALGGGGTDLEAISVDVVQASALQATAEATSAIDTARMARLDERDGSERQQEAAAEAPDRKPEQKQETAAKAETADLVIADTTIKPEPLTDLPAITIAPTRAEQPVDGPEKPPEPRAPPGIAIAATPSAPSDAAVAETLGGATAQGASVVETAMQSAALALTGELATYARLVQQAVARNPPKLRATVGGRGVVVINFALGLDGTLLRADISKSSGNSTLDDAALVAVRKTRFPSPPGGSQPGQLTYNFPVKFR